jgi:hypothetical protein
VLRKKVVEGERKKNESQRTSGKACPEPNSMGWGFRSLLETPSMLKQVPGLTSLGS